MNHFAYQSSIGASSGLLMVGSDHVFDGSLVHATANNMTMKFCQEFYVPNVYGPHHEHDKPDFIN